MLPLTPLNGRLPSTALTSIGGRYRLRTDAAASFLRASAARGIPLLEVSAYRTWAEQQQLVWDYVHHVPGSNPANAPGTSQHGEGAAVDLAGAAIAWMAAFGAAFGWTRRYVAEPWHFEYNPAQDRHRNPTPPPPAPPTPPTGDAEMNSEETRILNEADQNAMHAWETALATRRDFLADAVARLYREMPSTHREPTPAEVAGQVAAITAGATTLEGLRWALHSLPAGS